MSDLTETFAMVYLASATRGTVITFLHGVTGPAAVRTLLPYVSPEEQRRLLRYTWQACASFSSSAGGKTAPPPSPDAKLPSREELTDRAIATGDEHSIKFTEACFREYALNPKPVYILAASRRRLAPRVAELLHPRREIQLVERAPIGVNVGQPVRRDDDRADLLDAGGIRRLRSPSRVCGAPVVTSTMSTSQRQAPTAGRRRSAAVGRPAQRDVVGLQPGHGTGSPGSVG